MSHAALSPGDDRHPFAGRGIQSDRYQCDAKPLAAVKLEAERRFEAAR
jgi:hypothetical protein